MEALKRVQLKRLVVGKGKTSRPGDAEEWNKEYYEAEDVVLLAENGDIIYRKKEE
jgi:hypothetical protein